MHDLYGTLKSSRGINRRRVRSFPNCYIPAARNCLTTSHGDPASLSVAAPPAPTRVQHACNLYSTSRTSRSRLALILHPAFPPPAFPRLGRLILHWRAADAPRRPLNKPPVWPRISSRHLTDADYSTATMGGSSPSCWEGPRPAEPHILGQGRSPKGPRAWVGFMGRGVASALPTS